MLFRYYTIQKIFSEITGLALNEFDATILGFHNKDMFISETEFYISKDVSDLYRKKVLHCRKQF